MYSNDNITTLNNFKHSSAILWLQAWRQTQWQPASSDRLVWGSLESPRPARTWVWTWLDWPGITCSTCERSHHDRPIDTNHRRWSGPGWCWEFSLFGWFLLLPCNILWSGGAADDLLWLVSFCFWLLDWGHQPVWLAVLIDLMIWWLQKRVVVRGGTMKGQKVVISKFSSKRKLHIHSQVNICSVSKTKCLSVLLLMYLLSKFCFPVFNMCTQHKAPISVKLTCWMISEGKKRRTSKLDSHVYMGSPWSHNQPEAAQTNCGLAVGTSSYTLGLLPHHLAPSPPTHRLQHCSGPWSPWQIVCNLFPSFCSLGDDGTSSFPCSCQTQLWSSGGIWKGSCVRCSSGKIQALFCLACRALGNTVLDLSGFQGSWGAEPGENQVVSHSPACLCIWVCSALRPEGFDVSCVWRLVTNRSQEELVVPLWSHEPPHECAGLLLGFLETRYKEKGSQSYGKAVMSKINTTFILNHLVLLLPSRFLQDRMVPTCQAPKRMSHPSGQSAEHSATVL